MSKQLSCNRCLHLHSFSHKEAWPPIPNNVLMIDLMFVSHSKCWIFICPCNRITLFTIHNARFFFLHICQCKGNKTPGLMVATGVRENHLRHADIPCFITCRLSWNLHVSDTPINKFGLLIRNTTAQYFAQIFCLPVEVPGQETGHLGLL